MASLLAVVMLFSVVGISPAVFAEEAVAPELKANSGEVIIKSGMTNDEVAQILNKALISNYDELDDATKASLSGSTRATAIPKMAFRALRSIGARSTAMLLLPQLITFLERPSIITGRSKIGAQATIRFALPVLPLRQLSYGSTGTPAR